MSALTPQQRASLDVRGSSVVLATGAGCGKTTVLTGKFLAMLSEEPRVPIEAMVVLTFTDRAAAELRRRVRRDCRDRLARGDEPEYWRDVLRQLEAAPIGTFHTFCGEIVRRFAARAGVDPGFTILDEAIAATCREEAVDIGLRRALVDRDDDLRSLAVDLGLDAVRANLLRLLADRSAESLDKWGAVEPDDLIARWRQAFEEKVRPAILDGFQVGVRPCLDMIASRRDGFPIRMADAARPCSPSRRVFPSRPTRVPRPGCDPRACEVRGGGTRCQDARAAAPAPTKLARPRPLCKACRAAPSEAGTP